MNVIDNTPPLKAKDFASDQEVRWCPGCGDYAILKAVQKSLADCGARPENTVFISGIGCSSRFPYYMETYGFHTIHGRAPAFATGVKLANPDLDVWLISGDGDSLSIGGNHLMHILRRNVDVQYLLFNNEIYGLTKGQYSPTSRAGTRTPSTPYGSIDNPVATAVFALGCGGRFVARGIDTQQKNLVPLFERARQHKGASFVEILQNCIVYNDDVFAGITAKEVAADKQLMLEHGKPMLFGKDHDMGLRVKPGVWELEAVRIGENGITEDDVLIHDETNHGLAHMLASMRGNNLPVALGVIYCDPMPSYDQRVHDKLKSVCDDRGKGDLNALLRQGHTWTVE